MGDGRAPFWSPRQLYHFAAARKLRRGRGGLDGLHEIMTKAADATNNEPTKRPHKVRSIGISITLSILRGID